LPNGPQQHRLQHFTAHQWALEYLTGPQA
jgi:hypothetical protein